MNRAIDPRLIRLLGGDQLADLRLRLRRHYERADPDGRTHALRLSRLTPLERAALASLIGRPPSRANSMTIDVAEIDRALRDAGVAGSLRQALEHLDGSIVNRRQARAEAQAHWSAVAAGVRHPGLASLLRTPAGLALLLNLPTDRGPVLAEAGEPAYASLRLLLRSPPAWAVAGRTVFVCENPNLLAIAADQLGSRCAPLVCTDGMPAAAQRTLLRQLAAAGADLLYHGDFDWPGLRIANHVMQAHGSRLWRFGTADYQAAFSLVQRLGHKLAGTPVAAAWDAALSDVMV